MRAARSEPTPSERTVIIGEELEVRGVINATDPATGIVEPAKHGTVLLQVMPSTATTWTNIGTNGYPHQYYFPDVAPTTTSQYRVVYLGHARTNPYQESYTPSESPAVTVTVGRKITFTTKDLTVKGKVGPDFAGKKVTVLRKVGSRLRPFTKVRTDSRCRFKVTFEARRAQKVKFVLEAPADQHFVASRVTGEVVDW